ncbi:hypothetical protein J6590_024613 [Homalodisca vitripennis]|nr:hypothetical protein J6590_024613 [Homalodisca vitripennis]
MQPYNLEKIPQPRVRVNNPGFFPTMLPGLHHTCMRRVALDDGARPIIFSRACQS